MPQPMILWSEFGSRWTTVSFLRSAGERALVQVAVETERFAAGQHLYVEWRHLRKVTVS